MERTKLMKVKCFLGFTLAIILPVGGLFAYAWYAIGFLAALGVYAAAFGVYAGVYLMSEGCR